MKITNVECMVLDSRKNYIPTKGTEEPTGVRYTCLMKVETDEGISGWSDTEVSTKHAGHGVNSQQQLAAIGPYRRWCPHSPLPQKKRDSPAI